MRKAYPNEIFHAVNSAYDVRRRNYKPTVSTRINSASDAKRLSDERTRKRKARDGSGEAYNRAMSSMAPKNYNRQDAEWLTNAINRVLADGKNVDSSTIGSTIKGITTKNPRELASIANAVITNMRNNGVEVAVGGLTLNDWIKIRDLASRGYTANTEATIDGQFGGETYYSWRNRR